MNSYNQTRETCAIRRGVRPITPFLEAHFWRIVYNRQCSLTAGQNRSSKAGSGSSQVRWASATAAANTATSDNSLVAP